MSSAAPFNPDLAGHLFEALFAPVKPPEGLAYWEQFKRELSPLDTAQHALADEQIALCKAQQ